MISNIQGSLKPNTIKHTREKSSISTLAFDWVYVVLVSLVTAGVYLDGWSHGTFGPDQSVFSEYHLLFYTSLVAISFWLFGTAILNYRQGFSGFSALPAGYKLSALGIIIFGLTGVMDLAGHALFGFEVDLEALFSPSHMGLFLGWSLISIGPAQAALYRQFHLTKDQSGTTSLIKMLPTLFAWASLLNVLAFVSMNFFATTQQWMLVDERPGVDFYGQLLGIMGVIIQTAIIVGCVTWLTLRFRLPIGSFSFFFLIYALYDSINRFDFAMVPVFLVTGILSDVLYAFLKPNATRQLQFHVFNVLTAAILWGSFYTFLFATNFGGGVWYTPYIWTGSIAQGVVTALLVSLLSTSACKPTQSDLPVE